MCGNKSKGDGVLRKRFPGGWASDKRNAFNELGRTKLQQQYFAFTKRLLQWRKSCVAVAYGDLTHYMIRNGVYVYSRRFAAKTVTVIMNGRDRAVDFLLADYSEVLPDKIAFEVLSGRSIPIQESIKLEKRGIRILEF
jgi:hypothetical protein